MVKAAQTNWLFIADDFSHLPAMIEAPETPHVHHKPHEKHRWFDIGIALAVVLVSLGSLYVSLHTAETMEALVEQNSRLVRANSVPLVQFDTGNIGDDNVSPELYMAVRNVGTGPARIVWFEITLGGKVIRDFRDLLPEAERGQLERLPAIVTSSIAPSMMPAGERRKLLTWPKPGAGGAELSAWNHVDRVRQGIDVEACYCSLFDECWRTKAEADVPKPVPTCEVGRRISYQG